MSLASSRGWWSRCVAVWLVLSTPALAAMPAGPGARPQPAPTPIVPAPLHVTAGAGRFMLGAGTVLIVPDGDAELARIGAYVAAQLAKAGQKAPIVRPAPAGAHAPRGAIVLARAATAGGGAEGYRLDIQPTGARIEAATPHGVFNGAVSLLQLAIAVGDGGAIAAQRIEDAPRFGWRGLMLDSARHMQSVDEIKQFLDAMALHKLNTFQWHLTDDQGWRLAIDKYPRLTEVGAWRVPAGAAGRDAATGQARPYGGFYTQAQVREIVAYAAQRYITVVPEIDMPGHAQAAIAAYPALGTLGVAPPVSPDWGVHTYLFNAEEPTYAFLEDVLTEVIALFPGPFVHVGGDEAVKDQWKASPRVQQRMRELGVKDEAGLQAYLTARMQRFLAAHGRRLIGWDEILEGGLPPDAAVMSWRGVEGAMTATAQGHDSVLSPWPLLYLDNRQGTGSDEPPGRLHVVSLADIYAFDPMPPTFGPAQRPHLLGVQANVWTEHIRTAARVQWMAFPRAAAVSEVGWSAPARRDWNDFRRRLPALLGLYQSLGIAHADSAVAVAATWRPGPDGRPRVALASPAHVGQIRYTVDGSDPTPASPIYRAPLRLPTNAGGISAASFDGPRRLSHVTHASAPTPSRQRLTSADLDLCSAGIALALEDDAPATGPRAIFHLDIQNPCWIVAGVDLSMPTTLRADIGSVPFNFQIGADRDKIRFDAPTTASGELLVRLDGCATEPVLRIALGQAASADAVAALPPAALPRRAGRHDLCLRFSQATLEPLRTLDAITLVHAEDAR